MRGGGRGGLGEAAGSTGSTAAADGRRGGWRGSGGEGEPGGGSGERVGAGGGVSARSGTSRCSRHRGLRVPQRCKFMAGSAGTEFLAKASASSLGNVGVRLVRAC